MLDAELLALLVCPETHQDVVLATPEEITRLNQAIQAGQIQTVGGKEVTQTLEGALIRIDRAIAYPIREKIPVMLVPEGLIISKVDLVGATPLTFMAELAGKKLGVLLTVPPEHPNFRPAVALMTSALDADVRLYLYCIDEGVRTVGTQEIQALKQRGASLFGCAYGAGHRKIPLDDAAAWSGLTVLADVVGSTDKFVSF